MNRKIGTKTVTLLEAGFGVVSAVAVGCDSTRGLLDFLDDEDSSITNQLVKTC